MQARPALLRSVRITSRPLPCAPLIASERHAAQKSMEPGGEERREQPQRRAAERFFRQPLAEDQAVGAPDHAGHQGQRQPFLGVAQFFLFTQAGEVGHCRRPLGGVGVDWGRGLGRRPEGSPYRASGGKAFPEIQAGARRVLSKTAFLGGRGPPGPSLVKEGKGTVYSPRRARYPAASSRDSADASGRMRIIQPSP